MAAKETELPAEATSDDSEWETLKVGIGREWDFEKEGPLVGTWVALENVPLKTPGADGRTEAEAYVFAVQNTGEQVFVWRSYELSEGLAQAKTGDVLRVSYLGRESFVGDDGPRQVKRYQIDRKRA